MSRGPPSASVRPTSSANSGLPSVASAIRRTSLRGSSRPSRSARQPARRPRLSGSTSSRASPAGPSAALERRLRAPGGARAGSATGDAVEPPRREARARRRTGGRATGRRRSRRGPAPARPARGARPGSRRAIARALGRRPPSAPRRSSATSSACAAAPGGPPSSVDATPSSRSISAANECCASASVGSRREDAKPRSRAPSTPASQSVVLPMPGPPTSTSAVGDPAERNAPTSASSASRPISSVRLARGTAVGTAEGADRVAVRRRALEAGILDEHAALEVLQRRARVDPELVGERAPERLVARERLGLAARAVEGEHLLRAKALAQRVTGDERLELTHHLGVATDREVGLDAPLERREPELLEASGLGVGERLRELGQRRPAPQRQRAPDESEASTARPAVSAARPSATSRSKRSRSSSLVGELERVPGRTRVEPRLGQHLAELRDVDLHHLPRESGTVSPHRSSTIRSRETVRFAFRSSTASSARCLRAAIGSEVAPSTTSSGPRRRNSIGRGSRLHPRVRGASAPCYRGFTRASPVPPTASACASANDPARCRTDSSEVST